MDITVTHTINLAMLSLEAALQETQAIDLRRIPATRRQAIKDLRLELADGVTNLRDLGKALV